jgi:hypothetical protein
MYHKTDRTIKRINNDIEADRYCTTVFIDVLQASDKVEVLVTSRVTLEN